MGNPNFFYNFLTRKLDIGPDAGQNITVTNGNTVNAIGGGSSTEGLYNAGPGLVLSGSTFSAAPGYRMNVSSGTINQDRYFPIEVASGGSVTLQAGHYYQIFATSAAVTLNHETIPSGQAGLEGHAEIFLANSSYIITDPNTTTITTPLIPDAVNNCTLRFHDGRCIITLEDHVFGYIVTTSEPAGSGSLAYALSTSPNEYIAFDATLNGLTLDMAGAATNGEKHIVGNGYTQTILSGGVSCTSKTTFSNLGMNGVSVLGGTATLGDVFIDSGSTVSVNGGNLAIEKVTGSGGTIDLGGTMINLKGSSGYMSGVMLSGNNALGYPLVSAAKSEGIIGSCTMVDVVVSGVTTTNDTGSWRPGGLVNAMYGGNATLSSCSFIDNTPYSSVAINFGYAGMNNTLSLVDCIFSDGEDILLTCHSGYAGGEVIMAGTNQIKARLRNIGSVNYNRLTISTGAIVDLTGNTNAAPIAPGGGITFEQGGATVYPSAGQASAYMLGGITVPQIGNTNVLNLNGTNATVSSGGTAYVSGCTITNGSATYGGALSTIASASAYVVDCYVTACSATQGGGFRLQSQSYLALSGCVFSGNLSTDFIRIMGGTTAKLDIINCSFGGVEDIYVTAATTPAEILLSGSNSFLGQIRRYTSSLANVTISSGAIVDLTGNTNGTPIVPGGGITISSGGISIIDSAGSTHEFQDLAITGSTINNLGQILGATVSIPAAGAGVGPWIVYTTLGSSSVSATAEAQELVIEGGLVSIQEL